jgi:hypothetical protein
MILVQLLVDSIVVASIVPVATRLVLNQNSSEKYQLRCDRHHSIDGSFVPERFYSFADQAPENVAELSSLRRPDCEQASAD